MNSTKPHALGRRAGGPLPVLDPVSIRHRVRRSRSRTSHLDRPEPSQPETPRSPAARSSRSPATSPTQYLAAGVVAHLPLLLSAQSRSEELLTQIAREGDPAVGVAGIPRTELTGDDDPVGRIDGDVLADRLRRDRRRDLPVSGERRIKLPCRRVAGDRERGWASRVAG